MSRQIKDVPTSPLLENVPHKTKVNWIPATEATPTEDDDYLCTFGAETGWFVDWCSWYEGRWVTWIDDEPNPVSNVMAWCYPIEPYQPKDQQNEWWRNASRNQT